AGLGLFQTGFEPGNPRFVLFGRELDEGCRDADPRRKELGGSALRNAVEGVEEAVIVFLSHWIIFVIVTLSASHREAEPGCGGGRMEVGEGGWIRSNRLTNRCSSGIAPPSPFKR